MGDINNKINNKLGANGSSGRFGNVLGQVIANRKAATPAVGAGGAGQTNSLPIAEIAASKRKTANRLF